MDMYAENNGFQFLEGGTPFDDGSQVQGAGGFETETYQETAAEAVWYGDAGGAENLPAGQYQEPVTETAYYGSTDGAENFPAEYCQETAAEYEPAVYVEEADALPVGPGQMPVQETAGLGMYQDTAPEIGEAVLMQADMQSMEGAISDAVQETAELEMEELEMEEPESTDSEMKEPETPEAGSPAAETATVPDDEETGCKEHETAPDTDGEDDEETERARHEAAEAERKAEWEARQQAKKDALKKQQEELAGMSDAEVVEKSMKRIRADTEKLTRRNMKDCVAEYIQTLCLEDTQFARMTMNPRKSMIHCFQYINRKAWKYVQNEMKADGIRPGTGQQGYGCDIPDDLCYQWAEDYFRDPSVKEDEDEEEEEEKFVPKPYAGKAGSKAKTQKATKKKNAAQKAPAQKPAGKKAEKPAEKAGQEDDGQMSFPGQMSLSDIMAPEVKAG